MQEFSVKTETNLDNTHGDEYICQNGHTYFEVVIDIYNLK